MLLGLPPTCLGGSDLGLDMAEAVSQVDPRIRYALCAVGISSRFIHTPQNISSVMAELKRSQEEAKHHNSEDGGSIAMAPGAIFSLHL